VTNYSDQSWSDLLGKIQNLASNQALLANVSADGQRLFEVNRITQAQLDQIKAVTKLPPLLMAKMQENEAKIAAGEVGGDPFPHALRFQGSLTLRENLPR